MRRLLGGGTGTAALRLSVVAALVIAGLLIALTSAGAAGPDRQHPRRAAQLSTVTRAPAGPGTGVLQAMITPDAALLHDGVGVATVALADVSSSDVAVRRVRQTIHLPAPARATGILSSPGWRCRTERGGHQISCELAAPEVTSSSLAPVTITVQRSGRSSGRARLHVRATWTQPAPDGRPQPQVSSEALTVDERAPLSVGARSAQKTVIEPISGLPTTPTILEGTVGHRTPEPISYRWRQLCTGGPCPRVHWTSATNGLVLDGEQPVASFTPPSVQRPRLLRFALTASDPRGAVTAVTVVRVVPDQVKHIAPAMAGAAFARTSLHSSPKPVAALPLTKAVQATVSVGAQGAYRTRVNGLVRLDARVQGQRVTRARWSVAIGPGGLLARAKRGRTSISFRAPAVPGTYAVRVTARTASGSFARDELIEVSSGLVRSANVASAGPEHEQAFCAVLAEAREHRRISISLPSGGTFGAEASAPAGNHCSGTERIGVTGGSTELGSFGLRDVHGAITRDGGVVIAGGTLITPGFWSATPQSAADTNTHAVHGALVRAAQSGHGLPIPFKVPNEGNVTVGLEIPLTNAGFGDLTGGVSVDTKALAEFPLSRSLPDSSNPDSPHAWKMTGISLSVVPGARRFELTADARGPSTTGGEVSFNGVLTFDGQVSASLTVSNLAVFQSADGQKVANTVQGTVTLLPGQRFDPANPDATASFFPVIDVEASAEVKNYRPTDNLSLSGRVSWSSNGPLEFEGTLATSLKDTPVRFTVTGSYTDASNWTLYSRFEGGDRGLAIGSPELLALKVIEGTLSRHGGKLKFSLKGEAARIRVIPGLDVPSAKVEFSTGCAFKGEQNAPEDRLCLLVELESELSLPGKSPIKVSGAVKVDFSTLKFEAGGHVALRENDPLAKALGLHDVTMFVTNAGPPSQTVCQSVVRPAAAGGLYFGFTGKGKVLGLDLDVRGAYLGEKHFCLGATIGSASLPTAKSDKLTAGAGPPKEGEPASCTAENAPTLQNLTFAYSSDTEEGQFSGKFCFPSGVRKELGAAGTGVGSVDLFLSKSGGFAGKVSYQLPRVAWFLNAKDQNTPDPSKAALGFQGMTISVKAAPATGLSLGFDANGELSLPAPTSSSGGTGVASRAEVSVGVDISLSPAPELSIAANVGQNTGNESCGGANVRIHNAFGANGFNICHFGFGGSIGVAGFSLSVNAAFTLPSEWGPKLGVHNASLKIGFRISPRNPCLNLEIEKSNKNGPAALDLLNKGAIVANSAALRIAPSGCSLPGGTQLQPGISLKFDGTMFGTPTSVSLAITRKDPGLKIDFTQKTGASSLGPLKFGATDIRVLLDPGPPAETRLELHTSMTIGDHGGVKIDGSFSHSGGRTTLDASACLLSSLPPQGQPTRCGKVTLLGASFEGNVSLKFDSGTGAAVPKAEFSGRLIADLRFLRTDVNVRSLRYEGGLQEFDVTANTGFKLGPAEGHISGSVDYKRAAAEIKLELGGRVKLWGFETSFQLPAKFSTNVRLPFAFGPGDDTTRISQPRSLLVLRLSGKLDGKINPDGSIVVTHVLPIEGCFPFETVCVKIGDARVNTATGTVTFKVFGYDVVIDASKYVKHTPGQVDYSAGISYVANEQSGKCLDVKFGNFNNGTLLHPVDCSKVRNIAQEFRLLADGTLRARNAEGREFCVRGVAANGGSELQLAGCDINQSGIRWYRDGLGQLKGGYANRGHLCLAEAGGRYTLDGCSRSTKSERWVIVDMIRHPASPRVGCLDVPQGNLAAGVKLFGECNRSVNQAFALYPNGELKVRGQCVAAEISTGAALKLENCSGAPNAQQRWSLRFGQLCVGETDVPGSSPGSGGDFRNARCMAPAALKDGYFPVELRPFNDSDSNQKWDITY